MESFGVLSIDGPKSGCCKIDRIMVHFLCVLVTFHHIKNVCDGFEKKAMNIEITVLEALFVMQLS